MYAWNTLEKFCVTHVDDLHPDLDRLRQCISYEGTFGVLGRPSPLHFSTTGSNSIIMKMLLTYKADVNAIDNNGATPLHWACTKGNLEMVKLLLHYGADLNILDDDGCNVLHYSSESGNLDLVKFFVEVCKMNINSKNNEGKTPFAIACDEEETELIRYFCQQDTCLVKSILLSQARRNHSKSVYYLVKYGSLSKSQYSQETNPLHLSIALNYVKITKILLKYTPWMMDCANSYGMTPKDLITSTTKSKLVELFNYSVNEIKQLNKK